MNCKRVKKNLSEFLSDNIDKQVKRNIDEHIRQCESCKEELENVKRLDVLISQVKTPEQDKQFWESYPEEIIEKINMLPQKEIKRRKRRFEFPLLVRRPAYAVAFVVVLMIGFLSYQEWLSVDEQIAANYSNSLEFFIEEYDALVTENIYSESISIEEDILFYKDIN